jgi:hypothetical protein
MPQNKLNRREKRAARLGNYVQASWYAAERLCRYSLCVRWYIIQSRQAADFHLQG